MTRGGAWKTICPNWTQLISRCGQTVGPVHLYCTGPTFCPHRLISCVQLAQILPLPCHTPPYFMVYPLVILTSLRLNHTISTYTVHALRQYYKKRYCSCYIFQNVNLTKRITISQYGCAHFVKEWLHLCLPYCWRDFLSSRAEKSSSPWYLANSSFILFCQIDQEMLIHWWNWPHY